MVKHVLLTAAGKGTRLHHQDNQPSLPKQFAEVAERPLLAHTLLKAHLALPEAHYVLVLPKEHMTYWQTYCAGAKDMPEHAVLEGGDTRFASVRIGIQYLAAKKEQNACVAVHDGVRPLVSKEVWRRAFSVATEKGSAICVIPLTDSLREHINAEKSTQRDRKRYCLVQTPQVFRLSWLIDAFTQKEQPHFSDEATVIEQAGYPLHLIDGEIGNIKVTYADQLAWVRNHLSSTRLR